MKQKTSSRPDDLHSSAVAAVFAASGNDATTAVTTADASSTAYYATHGNAATPAASATASASATANHPGVAVTEAGRLSKMQDWVPSRLHLHV